MIRWIEDQILTFLQKRCKHPGEMVAADLLEGCGGDMYVSHCRRCGAVRPERGDETPTQRKFPRLSAAWRLPCPNLWRG